MPTPPTLPVGAKSPFPEPAATSYTAIRGTRLAELLGEGAFQVVKGQYFVDRHARGERIQMRQDVPVEYVWSGPEVVQRWTLHAQKFLVAISYSWLAWDHPDPDAYHLPKVAALVQEHRKSWPEVGEVGVVIDYCCLLQNNAVVVTADDEWSREQAELFRDALEEIDTIFGHSYITAWRLEQVPAHTARKYADRGWTLFESVLIDAKSTPSVLVLRDSGGSEGPSHVRALKDAGVEREDAPWRRGPPVTPERFDLLLQRRGVRSQAKGVALLANTQDLPLIQTKYRDAFTQIMKSTRLEYAQAEHWGSEEVEALLEALPAFRDLAELIVQGLRPEVGSHLAQGLAELLASGACPELGWIWVADVGRLARAQLRLAWSTRHASLSRRCCSCWRGLAGDGAVWLER